MILILSYWILYDVHLVYGHQDPNSFCPTGKCVTMVINTTLTTNRIGIAQVVTNTKKVLLPAKATLFFGPILSALSLG